MYPCAFVDLGTLSRRAKRHRFLSRHAMAKAVSGVDRAAGRWARCVVCGAGYLRVWFCPPLSTAFPRENRPHTARAGRLMFASGDRTRVVGQCLAFLDPGGIRPCDAAGPCGAPATKRGRTTWRCEEHRRHWATRTAPVRSLLSDIDQGDDRLVRSEVANMCGRF